MESLSSLVAKQFSGTLQERWFQKECLTEIFAWGCGHLLSMWSWREGHPLRLFQEAVEDFLSVLSGESENFGLMRMEC